MVDASSPVPTKSLREWHTPSERPEAIHELIHGVDRYNPSNLSFMEEYLSTQVKDGQYDLLANLAVLKLYQFNPQLSNPDVIINILLKALSATLNGPDFNLCMSLLREPAAILHDIESEDQSLVSLLPHLEQLHEAIRTCQFALFWKLYNSSTEGATVLQETYTPQYPQLLETFRLQFATSISSCFSRISLARLGRWLGLPQSEVAGWCSSVGWEVEGENAVVPKNGDNDVKAGVVKENVELSQLTKLIAAAAY